ncbi:MAG: DNA (cytosine-5-)-methyltransferase [Enterocloster bolteae]
MKQESIRFIDMFAGIGGFREGLQLVGGFQCVGFCECDKYAQQSYRALFDCEEEWYSSDARKIDPDELPEFDLLCGGFPCQAFSVAGHRKGFGDPRGTLFFELARLAEARKPRYLLFENVPGLLNHDGGRTFATILDTLERLGYHVEWQVLNSKDFGVPQSRRRVYIIGYLDERCRGKVFPFTGANETPLTCIHDGPQGSRVYDPSGVSCTLTSRAGGMGGKTGLYQVGFPVKEATRKGYKMAYPGDSIDLAYPQMNTRRGRVGHKIAHTLTTDATQGTLVEAPQFVDLNEDPDVTDIARCLTAKQNGGIRKHKREASGVLIGGRLRRLTPRECLRLQGWTDDRIDKILAIQSDSQVYKQAGNGVTVTVVEAIGKRLAAVDAEVMPH